MAAPGSQDIPPTTPRGPAAMVFAVAFVLYLALCVFTAWRGAILQPYSDMFDWLARWCRLRDGGDWGAYFWPAHNGHRLLLTLSLLQFDIRFLGGNGLALIGFAAAALAAAAALLGREAARAAPAGLALPAGVFAVMLALMAGNLLDVGTPINTTYVNALVFSVMALAFAERSKALALICAVIAPFGNAVALVVWPVLLLDALRRKAGWRWIALVAVLGALVVGIYVAGPGHSDSAARAPGSLVHAVQMFLSFLGLPWTRIAPPLGWIVGLMVLVPALAGLALRTGPEATASERLAARLILFTLGTAALAVLGRDQGELPGDVPLRYAVFVTPLHVGLLILALPFAANLNRRAPGAFAWGLAALAVLFLAQQGLMARKAIAANDRNRLIIADFRAGARTPETAMVYVNPKHATELSARLRADGVFQQELHLERARRGKL